MPALQTINVFQNKNNIYNKTVNLFMQKGKRGKALQILYKTLFSVKDSISEKAQKARKVTLNFQKDSKNLGFKKHIIKKRPDIISKEQHIIISTKTEKKEEEKQNHLTIFNKAMENVVPFMDVRKARSKGKTRQIPTIIKTNRQQTLAIRWLMEGAAKRQKQGNKFYSCLALELFDALKKQGTARQKRNELHKAAHANRANLRFRWW